MDRTAPRIRPFGFAVVSVALLVCTTMADENSRQNARDYKEAQFFARLGYRGLSGETWDAARQQTTLGFEGDWRPRGWPVWPTFSMNLSADTENDQLAGAEDGVLFDLSGGVKRYFLHSIRPYVGGGLAWVYGRQDRLIDIGGGIRATTPDRANTFGWYLQAGVSMRFGSRFHWGLDARILRAPEVTFFGQEASLDYDEVTLFVGWAW